MAYTNTEAGPRNIEACMCYLKDLSASKLASHIISIHQNIRGIWERNIVLTGDHELVTPWLNGRALTLELSGPLVVLGMRVRVPPETYIFLPNFSSCDFYLKF